MEVERSAADLILANEPNPASAASLARLFMPFHQNGTFPVGVRRSMPIPPFIRGESGDFTMWIQSATRFDLVRMLYAQALPSNTTSRDFDRIAAAVAEAFHYTGSKGLLSDNIPHQNYIDYIRRAFALYVCQDADVEFNSEASYNEFGVEIGLAIIEAHLERQLESEPRLATLRTLMVYSLLAGVIGLDMKCSHCAASRLTADNAAASHGDRPAARVEAIYQWLTKKLRVQICFAPNSLRGRPTRSVCYRDRAPCSCFRTIWEKRSSICFVFRRR